MEKRYRVVKDLQGGDFAMGIDQTIEEWRNNALYWAENDDFEGVVKYELTKNFLKVKFSNGCVRKFDRENIKELEELKNG